MESARLHGVPISAAQMAPKAAPSGIRAPLTVDESDFEYSVSSKGYKNSTTSSYYSGSELEYDEGFVSGDEEDESENAFKRPYVDKETEFIKDYTFSRPSVMNPDSEIARRSSNSDEQGFSRPLVKSPDERIAQESGGVGGNVIFRPFVRNPSKRISKGICSVIDSDDSRSLSSDSGDEIVEDEKYVLNKIVRDEEVSENGQSTVMDINNVPLVQKLHIPVAQISWDSDDDNSQNSDVLADEGFSGIVKVPSVEVLQRLNSTPRVRVLETDEESNDAENILEMDFVEDMEIGESVMGPNDANEKHIGLEETIHSDISVNTILDEDRDVSIEARDNSLAVNEEYNPALESGRDKNLIHLDEEIQEIGVIEDCESSNIGLLEENSVKNDETETEKLESESEQGIDQKKVDSLISIADHKIIFDDQYVDIKEVCSELAEALAERGQLDMFNDSLLEDGSLTGISDRCPSVMENTKLDEETWEEAENVEMLPGEATVAEMEKEQDTTYHSQDIDGEITTDSEVMVDGDGEISDRGQIIDSAAFLTVTGGGVTSDGSTVKPPSFDGVKNSNLESELEDLGPGFHSAGSIVEGRNLDFPPSTNGESENALSEREKTKIETQREDHSDRSLCILVIGKTGVGKSATINSIFGERKTITDSFEPATTKVREIIGTIDGFKLKIFDTPGLRTSHIDQSINQKILSSIKKLMKKTPPDVILYVDRLDNTQISNFDDLPILKSVTSYLGSSIWRKVVTVLTHADSIPPDGSKGCPLSCEAFVAHRSRVVQRLISQSAAMNLGFNIPVTLVENHPSIEEIRDGETPVHDGKGWRSEMLFLCYSIKTSSEMSSTDGSVQSVLSDIDPSFRYRLLEPSLRILTKPVLNSHEWDHDYGYDNLLVKDKTAYILRGKTGLKVHVSAGWKNKLTGQISVRTRCSDQFQVAALALSPIAEAIFKKIFREAGED